MSARPTDVAIIGAGLAGTLLALSLHDHLPLPANKITIYESRPPTAPELSSGVVLTPNGLDILSKLGVYPHIKDICWTNGYRTYKNDKDETTRRVLVASESLYGFVNHRIYRRVLLQIVKEMLTARGITILYNQRFEGITSDTASTVTFTINNTTQHTSLLIGADGIYSSVRTHITPTHPDFTGTVGCLAHIKWSSITWPTPTFDRQCTIQGQPGAFFMIPETRDGEDVMVGKQIRRPDTSRSDWESISRDTEAMCAFWRDGYDQWHDTGRRVIDAVTSSPARETLYLWPFLRMPKLSHWSSPTGNVVLVGDAAHAVPPSSGQGVNQALEDVWSLTLLLRGEKTRSRSEVLEFWRGVRQQRVDGVYEWATNVTNVARLGEVERRALVGVGNGEGEGKGDGEGEWEELFFDDMAWLYGWRCEGVVGGWLKGGGGGDGDGGVVNDGTVQSHIVNDGDMNGGVVDGGVVNGNAVNGHAVKGDVVKGDVVNGNSGLE